MGISSRPFSILSLISWIVRSMFLSSPPALIIIDNSSSSAPPNATIAVPGRVWFNLAKALNVESDIISVLMPLRQGLLRFHGCFCPLLELLWWCSENFLSTVTFLSRISPFTDASFELSELPGCGESSRVGWLTGSSCRRFALSLFACSARSTASLRIWSYDRYWNRHMKMTTNGVEYKNIKI